jgi:hypothetical protein
MRTFAVIENGIVVNIIVGVEPEVVQDNPDLYVEYTPEKPASIGWAYDGKTFIDPNPPIIETPA